MRMLLLLLGLTGFIWAGDGPSQELERGRLIPKVACTAEPKVSYALYLPRAYAPDRAWPLLLAFAPDAEGAVPVALFQAEAERLGWIVAGSLDSRNGPLEPNLIAQKALWEDLHRRFRIDPKRVVTTGFSGGARMALRLALDRPGQVAGVISFGAFSSWGKDLPFGLRLHSFLACGEEDFNFLEMREAQRTLESRSQKAWWEVHPGEHQWPPEKVASQALGFMQLQGPKPSNGTADSGLESMWIDERLKEAEVSCAEGRSRQALRIYENLVARFPGNPRVDRARQAAKALSAEPAMKAELEAEETAEKQARRILAARDTRDYLILLRELDRKIGSSPRLDARFTRMLLRGEWFVLQDMARESWSHRDFPLCAERFSALAELAPERPVPAYLAACACAQAGDLERGLSWLRQALERGFKDQAALRQDPLLAPLRKLPGFSSLVKNP